MLKLIKMLGNSIGGISQVTNRVTFEADRFPSGNVLVVKLKGGCLRRPAMVIECSFEGGHCREGSGRRW